MGERVAALSWRIQRASCDIRDHSVSRERRRERNTNRKKNNNTSTAAAAAKKKHTHTRVSEREMLWVLKMIQHSQLRVMCESHCEQHEWLRLHEWRHGHGGRGALKTRRFYCSFSNPEIIVQRVQHLVVTLILRRP